MLTQTNVFKVNIELRHKQLRDLITLSDGIIFPDARCLFKLDSQGNRSILAPLPASPHCLEAQGELVLCGGVSRGNGQVTIVGKSVDVYDVGCELINSVGFIESWGFACCNDNGLYIGDLSCGWKPIRMINALMPVNSAAYSRGSGSSSDSLALCGDRPGVLIHSINSSRDKLHLNSPPNADCGISISYSPCGELLAAAFQSGETCIWDVRNYRTPLFTMHSVKRGPIRGAFRVAEFASGIHDLLFVSEEQGVVHMIDLRTLEEYLVLLDDTLTVERKLLFENKGPQTSFVPDLLPDTLGLACKDNQVVIGTTRGIRVAEVSSRRNYFPAMDWR